MPGRSYEDVHVLTSDIAAELPMIDYGKLMSATEERKHALRQLDQAFETKGFAYLVNHSIPQDMVDEAFSWVWNYWAS